MRIINAGEEHIPAIQEIYAYHVIHGTASFETEPPGVEEMLSRLRKINSQKLPWYVAIGEEQVIGYCYLTHYRERYAYRFTLENSIYISPAFQKQGIGKQLLGQAIDWAEANGYRQLIAIVGDSSNHGSLKLHQRAGFMEAGTLKNIGFKHGRWLDTVLLQRSLGEGSTTFPPDATIAL
ncbi:phosphinothricin N-acetyltransferase [Salmonella enterica subsp. enterica serovar Choleraesuis]|nr:phosphinothricin N-acetyltransferase [Salmonella enterica subsp. enterica serovar Choleraesuis]